MFGIGKLQEENKRLREENAVLRKQAEEQGRLYRQWNNLLGYDGSQQKNNLEEEARR